MPPSFAAAGSTLLTGLTHYWTLDEASGVRNDSIGDFHLTDNNTVGSTAGKNENAARTERANLETLTYSAYQQPVLEASLGGIFCSCWFRFPTVAAGVWYPVYASSNVYGAKWYFGYHGYGGFMYASFNDYGVASVEAIWGFAPTANTWHNIQFWLDSDGKTRGRYDGAAVVASAATHTGNFPGTDQTNTLVIGGENSGAASGLTDIDEVGIWNRILSTAEQDELYNSGAGKFYPFT